MKLMETIKEKVRCETGCRSMLHYSTPEKFFTVLARSLLRKIVEHSIFLNSARVRHFGYLFPERFEVSLKIGPFLRLSKFALVCIG